MTERQALAAILSYLAMVRQKHRLYFFRSGAGMIKTEAGHMFRTGAPGCPDISVVCRGQYVGLEVKAEKGKITTAQALAKGDIERAGGEYHIVRTAEEVKAIIEKIAMGEER